MMKRFLPLTTILLCLALTLSAVTEYDIGGGKTLVVYDDGSSEIVEKLIDPIIIVGRQYSFDAEETVRTALPRFRAENPLLAFADEDFLISMLVPQVKAGAQNSDISLIFITKDELQMVINGKGNIYTGRTNYRLVSGGVAYMTLPDIGELQMVFNKDYSQVSMMIPGEEIELVFSQVN